MKLQLKKDYLEAKADSIVECDEVQAEKLLKEGIAQEYKEQVIDSKEIEIAVKQEVEKKLQEENKIMENKEMDKEFAIGKMVQHLAKKTISGNSETSSAADGGALVATGIADLQPLVLSNSVVYSRCRKVALSKNCNSMKLPFSIGDYFVKATAPVIETVAEGIATTPTKLQFGSRTLTLTKSVVAVPVSDELLEDVPALDSWLRAELVSKMGNILDLEITTGSSAAGYQAVIGDTGYTVVQTLTSTPTYSELVAMTNKVNPQFNPAWFMSITMWALMCNTFGDDKNLFNQRIDVIGKKLLGKDVIIMPGMAATDCIYGDFSQYAVLESNMGDRFAVSADLRFYEGEIIFKLTHRGAGACIYPVRATGDSLTIGAFVSK